MPRKCSICTHPQADHIDTLIRQGVAFRSIASQTDTDDSSVQRHAEKHLGFELRAVIEQQKVKNAINVHDEFAEELSFARRLRIAALDYLSDPDDPLKVIIAPRADEIDIVYYDHSDVIHTQNGDIPKKKKAKLQSLLERAESGNIDCEKVTIKHTDLRNFAITSITKCESILDRFANLAGLYKAPQPNKPEDRLQDAVKSVMQMEGSSFADALQYIFDSQRERGVILFPEDVIRSVALSNGIQLQTQDLGTAG